jgi:hypothetical protein|tara:strand:+ start:1355 stop:1750 length:396 start_codon:yes stop_codon:yes gene_type:complete
MKETKPYPSAPITIIPIELWSDEKQDQYIAGRVKLHQDAEYERLTGGSLPLCSDLERWARPSTWAVKKTANKRAMRVFDSEQEAEEYFNDKNLDKKHSIEERIGKNVRCEADYCGVARWCDQFEAIKNGSL